MTPEIAIKGQAYPLRFGMGFLRDLDASLVRMLEPGIKEEVGFQYQIAFMIDGNLQTLVDILLLANKTESPRLTQDILDRHLEDPDTDIKKIKDDVLRFLESSNVCKTQMDRLRETLTLGKKKKEEE